MKTILSLLLLIPCLSWGIQMKSLEDILKDNPDGFTDSSVLYYSLIRCSSLYMTVAGTFSSDEEISNRNLNLSNSMLEYAYLIGATLNGENYDHQKTLNEVNELRENITIKYIDTFNDNWENSGSYFNDFVKSDLEFCKSLYEEIDNS